VSRKKVYLVLHPMMISIGVYGSRFMYSLGFHHRCITWTFPILVLLGLLEWSPSSFTLNWEEIRKRRELQSLFKLVHCNNFPPNTVISGVSDRQ